MERDINIQDLMVVFLNDSDHYSIDRKKGSKEENLR